MTDAVAEASEEVVQHEDGKASPPRIQVSFEKKTKYFYVSLAKKLLQQHSEVRLSALGSALDNMIWVAQTLKNNGLAIEVKVITDVDILSIGRPRPVKKAKMEVLLAKSENFEEALKEQARLTLEKREMRLEAAKEDAAGELDEDSSLDDAGLDEHLPEGGVAVGEKASAPKEVKESAAQEAVKQSTAKVEKEGKVEKEAKAEGEGKTEREQGGSTLKEKERSA